MSQSPTSAPSRRSDSQYNALNPAYPRSWWTIAFSSDVKIGEVTPAKILERDIVLWRDSEGALHCMAAHCLHLGVHLGTGGAVVNDELQCPFHGWRYDATGKMVGVNGPDKIRRNLCLPKYRVIERHGGIFLWNGADEPDIEFPDVLGDLGLKEEDVIFCQHRWYLPWPAKYLAENTADGSHFAITHDTGGWAETVILEETPTALHLENRVHDAPKWWTWDNLLRRAKRHEITNILAAINNDVTSHCYGATLYTLHFSGRNKIIGSTLICFTPVDENSFCIMDMMLMPRVRVPVVGPLVNHVIDFALGAVTWGTIRQDVPLMMRRAEPANPPYAPVDKSLIALRRLWDSRIDSGEALDGPSVRYNGLRAGIRPRAATKAAAEDPSVGVADMEEVAAK